jgi:hypothetical protein
MRICRRHSVDRRAPAPLPVRLLMRLLVRVAISGAVLTVPCASAHAGTPHLEPMGAPVLDETRVSGSLPLRRDGDPGVSSGGVSVPKLAVMVLMLAVVGTAVAWARRQGTDRCSIGAERRPAWLSRLFPVTSAAPLRVLQSARLTTRASVHVLQWDGKEWLVGCTEDGMTVIGQRAQDERGEASSVNGHAHPIRQGGACAQGPSGEQA